MSGRDVYDLHRVGSLSTTVFATWAASHVIHVINSGASAVHRDCHDFLDLSGGLILEQLHGMFQRGRDCQRGGVFERWMDSQRLDRCVDHVRYTISPTYTMSPRAFDVTLSA